MATMVGAGSTGLESPRACHGERRDGSQARLGTCAGRRAGVVNACVCVCVFWDLVLLLGNSRKTHKFLML